MFINFLSLILKSVVYLKIKIVIISVFFGVQKMFLKDFFHRMKVSEVTVEQLKHSVKYTTVQKYEIMFFFL